MQFVAAIAICLAGVAFSSSCRKARTPASVVNMADPGTAKQLISGFYHLEGGSWRWTTRQFSVALGPPPGSAAKGAKLLLQLHVPDSQIERLGAITLCAKIRRRSLDPQVFSKPDNYIYERDVPADLLDTNVVPVTFSLDKWVVPAGPWERELGVVVGSIGLISK